MALQDEQHEYSKLPQDTVYTEPDGEPQIAGEKKRGEYRFTKVQLFLGLAVTIIISCGLTAVALHTKAPSSPTNCHHPTSSPPKASTPTVCRPEEPKRMRCGSSAEEAIALGCKFDQLSYAWLPSYCPMDALEEFKAAAPGPNGSNWRYWADREGLHEHPTPEHVALNRPGELYYTTLSEHLNHCKYMLLRVHKSMTRARQGDLLIDATANSYHHMKHCVNMLFERAKGPNDEMIRTWGPVAYGSC